MTLRVNGPPLPNSLPHAIDRARDLRAARDARPADEAHPRARGRDDDEPAFVLPTHAEPRDELRPRALGRDDHGHADGGGAGLRGRDGHGHGRTVRVGPNGLPVADDDRGPRASSSLAATLLEADDPDAAALEAAGLALEGEATADDLARPLAADGLALDADPDAAPAGPNGKGAAGFRAVLTKEGFTASDARVEAPGGKVGPRLSAAAGLPKLTPAASPAPAPSAASAEAGKSALAAQSMLQTAATNLATQVPPLVDLAVLDTLGLDVARGLELRLGLGRERDADRDLDSLAARMGADHVAPHRLAEQRVVPVEPSRPIGPQVADAVSKLMSDAAADGVIRFKGGAAGNFTAHVVQEGLGVTVRLVPDDPAGRSLFTARLPEVRDALVRAGIRLDALDVRTSTDGRSGGRDPRERDLQKEETAIFKELD